MTIQQHQWFQTHESDCCFKAFQNSWRTCKLMPIKAHVLNASEATAYFMEPRLVSLKSQNWLNELNLTPSCFQQNRHGKVYRWSIEPSFPIFHEPHDIPWPRSLRCRPLTSLGTIPASTNSVGSDGEGFGRLISLDPHYLWQTDRLRFFASQVFCFGGQPEPHWDPSFLKGCLLTVTSYHKKNVNLFGVQQGPRPFPHHHKVSKIIEDIAGTLQ